MRRARAVLTKASPEQAEFLKDPDDSPESTERARALLQRLEQAEHRGERTRENARRRSYEEDVFNESSARHTTMCDASVQAYVGTNERTSQTVAEIATQTHCDASTSTGDVDVSGRSPSLAVPTDPEDRSCEQYGTHKDTTKPRKVEESHKSSQPAARQARCKVFKPRERRSGQLSKDNNANGNERRAGSTARSKKNNAAHNGGETASGEEKATEPEEGQDSLHDDEKASLTVECDEELHLDEEDFAHAQPLADDEIGEVIAEDIDNIDPSPATGGNQEHEDVEEAEGDEGIGTMTGEDDKAAVQSIDSLAELEREIEEQHRHLLRDGVISPDELSSDAHSR